MSEEDLKLLNSRVLRQRVDELMQEPYDEDMEGDDFLTGTRRFDETKNPY